MLLSKDIKRFLNSCGLFITSGIIIDKTKEVEENLIANGLEVVKVETMVDNCF
jgi:ribosomal protein L11 methyltransferase